MHSVGMCKNINPTKIITNFKYTPPPKPPKDYKFYVKVAGNFEIKAKNKEIREKFEEIKKILKETNCKRR